MIDAAEYTSTSNIPLVLNTPFAMIKSIDQQQLEAYEFFEDAYAEKWFTPIRQYDQLNTHPKPTMICRRISVKMMYSKAMRKGT